MIASCFPESRSAQGSIIGARSVVIESVPEFAVAAGNPARVIRRLDDAALTASTTTAHNAAERS